MDEISAHRRRFGLRSLLLLITAAAVASWAYFLGWPWWKIYWERAQFEESCKRLVVGTAPGDAFTLLSWHDYITVEPGPNVEGHPVGLIRLVRPDSIYFIYYVYARHTVSEWGCECTSVEVFRLPPVPQGYQAQTERGREAVKFNRKRFRYPDSDVAYMNDFLAFVSGKRGDNCGFKYKLVHADPPQSEAVSSN